MTMTLDLDGDTGLVARRRLRAAPKAVYDAHLDPTLIPRWMLGPDGWTMPVCRVDARPGGVFEFRWENDGQTFAITGEYIALDRPHRIEHVERMHMPDPTPDNHIVTTFEPDGDGTELTMRMRLPSKAARAEYLAFGVEDGMAQTYDRLDALDLDAAQTSS